MSFKCKLCASVLINRFHTCGVLDTIHHVEIVAGGASWGNPLMGAGGFKDKTM